MYVNMLLLIVILSLAQLCLVSANSDTSENEDGGTFVDSIERLKQDNLLDSLEILFNDLSAEIWNQTLSNIENTKHVKAPNENTTILSVSTNVNPNNPSLKENGSITRNISLSENTTNDSSTLKLGHGFLMQDSKTQNNKDVKDVLNSTVNEQEFHNNETSDHFDGQIVKDTFVAMSSKSLLHEFEQKHLVENTKKNNSLDEIISEECQNDQKSEIQNKPGNTVSIQELGTKVNNLTDDLLKNKGHMENSTAAHHQSSLVFVFDATGSMWDDLVQVRKGAALILEAMLERADKPIYNYILVPFRDPLFGPVTVTTNDTIFKDELEKVSVYGGGDCPEMSLSGIKAALEVSLPFSYIYVFTDATAADHLMVNGVLDLVQRKQSQIVFVLTGDCNDREKPSYQVYEQIASASSGQVFHLGKTDVYKVLQFVKDSLDEHRVNLGSIISPEGYDRQHNVAVDDTIKQIMVSVAGGNPQIVVVDPSGKELGGPPEILPTLELSKIKVVTIVHPEPGNWTITVGSEDRHSVKVTGISDVTFQHGFSVQTPKSLMETSHRPLQGTENALLIEIKLGKDDVANLTSAELLTTSGDLIFELPLERLDDLKQLYKSDMFLPPEQFFYLAINGFDRNKFPLHRIGTTAIQPQLPGKPFLVMQPEITSKIYGSVILSCEVESLVPMSVSWFRDGKQLQDRQSFLQSTVAEIVIRNVTLSDEGSYICRSGNIAGASVAQTLLKVIGDPPLIRIEPQNFTVLHERNVTIGCYVTSELPLTSLKLFFQPNENALQLRHELSFSSTKVSGKYTKAVFEIENFSKNNGGHYTCSANNRGGSREVKIILKALPPLKIQTFPNIVEYKENEVVTFSCEASGAERINWVRPLQNGESTKVIQDKKFHIEELMNKPDRFLSNLSILNGALVDSGIYVCIATRGHNNVNSSVHAIYVEVPSVKMSKNHFLTEIRNDAFLKCSVKGIPAPKITWEYGGRVIVGGLSEHIEVLPENGLLIKNVSIEDTGNYSCHAENQFGKTSTVAFVEVWQRQIPLQIPNDLNVTFGDPLLLNCNISSFPPSTVSWTHNNVGIYNGVSLYLKSVNLSNSGKYKCIAKNKHETSEFEVTVGVTGLENPLLLKGEPFVVANDGELLVIPCSFLRGRPTPKLYWEFNRKSLLEPSGMHVTKDNSLKIEKITPDHEGNYSCIGENTLGKDFYNFILEVYSKPIMPNEVAEMQSDFPMEAKVGDPVSLKCEAYGKPKPLVTWSKDGMPVIYDNVMYIGGNDSLIISKAREMDTGVYSCYAQNPLGSAQKRFTLIILVPPIISSELLEPVLRATEGQLITLPCRARAKPKPQVRWLLNEAVIRNGDKKQIDVDNTLRFVANATDSGIYQCEAINKVGNITQEIVLLIFVPPIITPSEDELMEVTANDNVTCNCNAIGFPEPFITWSKDGVTLVENTTDVIFDNFGHLQIINISKNNTGLYVCNAENNAGFSQKVFNVILNESPRIITDFPAYMTVITGEKQLRIPCKAEGNPAPFVTWLKDDVYLSNSINIHLDKNGDLILLLPTEKVKGVYTCEASNKKGADRRSYSIDVLAPPTMIQGDQRTVDIVAIEGDNLTIECPVGNTTSLKKIQWYKSTNLISTSENSTRFIFKNVSRNDQSEYSCQASNAVGFGTAIFRLNVEWQPSLFVQHRGNVLSFSSDDVHLDFTAGDSLELKCLADGNPVAEVKWYKESLPYGYDGDTLSLKNVTVLHSGIYSCIAANYLGSASQKININIYEPPRIRGQLVESIFLKSGNRGLLECMAEGVPRPDVQWILSNDTNWTVDHNNSNKIILDAATQNSEGNITCRASNVAGVADKTFNVLFVETGKLQNIMLYVGDNGAVPVHGNITAKIGDRVKVSCTASGVPQPSIQWISNGVTLIRNDNNESSIDMIFDKIMSEDAKNYSCLVNNDAGFDQRNIQVDVQVPPKISHSEIPSDSEQKPKKLFSIEVLEGQPFKLRCRSTGNPVADLYWFKDRKFMVFYDNNMSTRDGGELLVVLKSNGGHSGNYTCVARNSVGEDHMNYRVEVLVPPSVEIQDHTKGLIITAKVGHDIHLECPVVGNPQPIVRWLKHPYTELIENPGKVTIDWENGSLVIYNATLDDIGSYSCIATNVVGARDVIYTVKVVQPPTIAEFWIKGLEVTHGKYGHIIKAKVRRGFQLRCNTFGYPEPKITWIKDGVPLYLNRDTLHVSLDGMFLTITDAELRDTGLYTCNAENEAGLAHKTFEVIVLVPAEWSPWSVWSNCTAACGLGLSERHRTCDYFGDISALNMGSSKPLEGEREGRIKLPNEILDKSLCKGEDFQSKECNQEPCRIDGGWSEWSEWTSCSTLCGSGTRRRYRHCDSPSPRHGGKPCTGGEAQQELCEGTSCAQWLAWSPWSTCSVTCGRGLKNRRRKCAGADTSCLGNATQVMYCNMRSCPVDGGWSDWSGWSGCSPACSETSQRFRTRKCNNPPPKWQGSSCSGANMQIEKCFDNFTKCPNIHNREENTINTDNVNFPSKQNNRASLVITGNLNGIELPPRQIEAEITERNGRRYVNASINDILQETDSYLPFITFMVSPIDVDDHQQSVEPTSYEDGNAADGRYLKHLGNFLEDDIQFVTGEEVRIIRKNFTQTKYGNLKVEITVDGTIPEKKPMHNINSTLYVQRRNRQNPRTKEGQTSDKSFPSRNSCEPGLKYNSTNGACEDINECELKTNYCHPTQMCENVFSSYSCLCQKGYVSTGVGQRCLDINECIQEIDDCSHQCINVAGGYLCLCPPELTLSLDKKTCIAVDSETYWPNILQGAYLAGQNANYLSNKTAPNEIGPRPPKTSNSIRTTQNGRRKINRNSMSNNQQFIVKPYNPPNYEEYSEYAINESLDGSSLEDFPFKTSLEDLEGHKLDERTDNDQFFPPRRHLFKKRYGYEDQNLDRSVGLKQHNEKRGYSVLSPKVESEDFLDDDCPTGFYKDENNCQDIDECSVGLHSCSDTTNACINTDGAYMCLPTPCPNFYEKTQDYNQCEQKCDLPGTICSEKAALGQYVIYIIKSFSESSQKMPGTLLKLEYGGTANYTEYMLESQPVGESFDIKTEELYGVLSANTRPSYKHINRLIITSSTHNENATTLLYFTRFIIYLYITE